jgi:hypothetical protein
VHVPDKVIKRCFMLYADANGGSETPMVFHAMVADLGAGQQVQE